MEERRIGAGTAVLLAIAFLAEVAMLVGLAWAGWWISDSPFLAWVLAILLPSAAAVVWGTWLSPKAPRRLATPYRWAAKVTLVSGTLLLLVGFGPQPEAAVFGALMWLAFLVSLPADRTALHVRQSNAKR